MGFAETAIASLKNNALLKRKRIYNQKGSRAESPIPIRRTISVLPTAEELEAMEQQAKLVSKRFFKKRLVAILISIVILGLLLSLAYYLVQIASSQHWTEYLF